VTVAAVTELRSRPVHGDIRVDRPISAEARVLAERAASIRRLRERPRSGMWFIGSTSSRAA